MFFLLLFFTLSAAHRLWTTSDSEPEDSYLERKRRSFQKHNSTPPSCGFSHLQKPLQVQLGQERHRARATNYRIRQISTRSDKHHDPSKPNTKGWNTPQLTTSDGINDDWSNDGEEPRCRKEAKKPVFLTNHRQEEQRQVAAAPTTSLVMVTTKKPIAPPPSLRATSCEFRFGFGWGRRRRRYCCVFSKSWNVLISVLNSLVP